MVAESNEVFGVIRDLTMLVWVIRHQSCRKVSEPWHITLGQSNPGSMASALANTQRLQSEELDQSGGPVEGYCTPYVI